MLNQETKNENDLVWLVSNSVISQEVGHLSETVADTRVSVLNPEKLLILDEILEEVFVTGDLEQLGIVSEKDYELSQYLFVICKAALWQSDEHIRTQLDPVNPIIVSDRSSVKDRLRSAKWIIDHYLNKDAVPRGDTYDPSIHPYDTRIVVTWGFDHNKEQPVSIGKLRVRHDPFITLWEGEGSIEGMMTAPLSQGQGYGSITLDGLITLAGNEDIHTIYAWLYSYNSEDYVRKLRFFEKFGFADTGVLWSDHSKMFGLPYDDKEAVLIARHNPYLQVEGLV